MFAGVRAIAAAWAMVCVSFAAVAQIVPPSDLPGRERYRFETPSPPLAQPGGPTITLPGVEAPPGAAETRLRVRKFTIVGSTVYTAEQLAELYADLIGETVTLKEVYELAGKITAKYGADGYVLSRAIIPPQELNPNGADVRIQVVEGYIERVEWPPLLDKYRDFFSDYAAKITAARPANIRIIERYLLLAGDLPGLKFENTIKPHPSKVGAAILVVEVTEKPADLFSRADNRGTPARGPIQGLTTVTANNLLRIHEAFSFTYAGSSKPRELQYQALNYRQVLTSEGLTGFFNASYGHGRPGTFPLEILDYRTQSQYTEVGLTYPVIRARERNFNLTGLWFWSDDRSSFFDMPDQPPSTLDKMRGFRLRAETDWADQFAGINQLGFTQPWHPGTGQHDQRQRARLARPWSGRFHQGGIVNVPAAAAVRHLLGPAGRLRPIRLHPAPGLGAVRLWRAGVRAGIRPLAVRQRHLLRMAGRAALRYAHSAQGGDPSPAVCLRRSWLAPQYCPGSGHIQGCGCFLYWSRFTVWVAELDHR
jgi:hemolysin activation/secretion protein